MNGGRPDDVGVGAPRKSTSEPLRSRYYSQLLELDGEPTEAAVKATEQLFSVSRSTVFAARKHLPVLAEAVPDDPAARRSLIAALKSSSNEIGELTRPLFW